jgi:hypothetical protein
MRSDEYRRVHLACLDMAKQSDVPDAQARWLAMATAFLNLAIKAAERQPDGAEVKSTRVEKNASQQDDGSAPIQLGRYDRLLFPVRPHVHPPPA